MIIVYVLESEQSGKLYTGISKDIARRLAEHNSGKSKYTSGYGKWKLVYHELVADYKRARAREKYLKSAAGRRWLIKKLVNRGSLPD